jgi:hypothetical protein
VRTIDPDNYVNRISPRKLLLLHSKYDQTISSLQANRTYDYASEPKLLLLDTGTDHGYYRHEKVLTLGGGLDWLLGEGAPLSQIANPASVYCAGRGGTVIIKETPAGQAGYCLLAGRAVVCDEWAYFRNETGACEPFNESFFG